MCWSSPLERCSPRVLRFWLFLMHTNVILAFGIGGKSRSSKLVTSATDAFVLVQKSTNVHRSSRVVAKLVGDTPTESARTKSYIVHDPCPTQEGLGESLQKLVPIIDVAQRFNLTYVCSVGDFSTNGHATGNLGFSFGCSSDREATGSIATYEVVQGLGLRREEAVLQDVGTESIHLSTPIQPGVVYHVQSCNKSDRWFKSYEWFRSQYHLVRDADQTRRTPRCTTGDPGWSSGQSGVKRSRIVAVAIRRGDGKDRGFSTETYAAALDKLFAGAVPGVDIREQDTNLVIIAEAPQNATEMRVFDKYQRARVSYLLGDPETNPIASQQRFIRDLDCLTTSDVLLLSKGSFSSMAAALQKSGVALVLQDERHRNDMPNAMPVGAMLQIGAQDTNPMHLTPGVDLLRWEPV
eukprot:TRINITY_DN3181_c0_g1_i3.p1 TRINITY_DN3181_c0_g1~~TRINITY_DN3181_c0_g1_i3.p1  ORF type:complete len:421 (+),score=26.91 TRINITY_DN3181_c0_g1_i3:40-1263(+)